MDKNNFINNFFKLYYEHLFAYTFKVVGEYHVAEDILSNFFSNDLPKLILKHPNLVFDFTQLIRLAKTCLKKDVIDYFRRRKREDKWAKRQEQKAFECNPFQRKEDEDFAKFTLQLIVNKAGLNFLESEMLRFELLSLSVLEISELMQISEQRVYNIRTTMMRKLRNVI